VGTDAFAGPAKRSEACTTTTPEVRGVSRAATIGENEGLPVC
jgi:hypothetical protein